jgi:hypothetical protein
MGLKKSTSILFNEAIATTTSWDIDCNFIDRVAIQATYSDVAPAADTFADADVDVTENTITLTGHAYITGTKVAATTSGVLPGGLSATNYYVIDVDDDTIKLASSLANAVAGTAVDITSAAGGGTHTLTPATSASNVLKLQVSNDGVGFADLGTYTVTIATSSATTVWHVGEIYSRYLRVIYTPSAGQVSLKVVATQTPL